MSQVTVLHVSSTNKTDHLDIAEILLKHHNPNPMLKRLWYLNLPFPNNEI